MSAPEPPAPGAVLRARRNRKGLTQLDLEAETGVSQATISEIERGEQDLTAVGIGRVSKLAHALGWTLADLEGATGLELNTGAAPSTIPTEDYSVDRTPPSARDAHIFPAGCGPGFSPDESIGVHPVGVRVPDDRTVVHLEARGHSMEPELFHGDLATVVLDDGDVRPGMMVGVHLPDAGVCVKWFVRDGETLWLGSSSPPPHEPRVFPAPGGTRILGRVVGIVRRGTPTRPELVAPDLERDQ